MMQRMTWVGRIWLASWLLSLTAACSATVPTDVAATAPILAAATPATASRTAGPTLAVSTRKASASFPRCPGMELLTEPVQFDWPTLAEHQQDFSRSQWTYFSCDEPAAEAAALYRQELPQPPYGLEETNWLDRQESALGVYFSQAGAWDYIWFVPQPGTAQKSYVIISESFAYV